MSDFKAKMHQIRFPLGLRPIHRWGAYSAPPDPLNVFKGPTSKGRGKGRGLEGPPISCWHRAPPEGLIRHCYFQRRYRQTINFVCYA